MDAEIETSFGVGAQHAPVPARGLATDRDDRLTSPLGDRGRRNGTVQRLIIADRSGLGEDTDDLQAFWGARGVCT